MAYHREHVQKFVAAAQVSTAKTEEIMQRVESALKACGSDDGYFAGGDLNEVLGDTALVSRFQKMWEAGQLQR